MKMRVGHRGSDAATASWLTRALPDHRGDGCGSHMKLNLQPAPVSAHTTSSSVHSTMPPVLPTQNPRSLQRREAHSRSALHVVAPSGSPQLPLTCSQIVPGAEHVSTSASVAVQH
jgi:hypothetical protein